MLFGKKQESESVVIIDIDSSSIGAGLVHYSKELPTLYYSTRLEIELREHESPEDAMVRTLEETTHLLITKGAPVLHKAVGNGSISRIVVTIGSPWQQTSIRMETINNNKPFVYTKALHSELLQKDFTVPAGYVKSVEDVIATVLNGYIVGHAFGKKVNRAQLIILSSLIKKDVFSSIEKTIRKSYHTHSLTITAFAPAAFQVFRDIFPHEKDLLVLHVSGEATDMMVVKHRVLEDVDTTAHGLNELLRAAKENGPDVETPISRRVADLETAWLENLRTTFQALGKRHALPRNLFLVSDSDAYSYLQKLMDSPILRNLWLSDDPLQMIPIQPSHFAPFLRTRGEAITDTFLSMIAIYARKKE